MFLKLLVFIGLIHYSLQQSCVPYNPQDLTFPCNMIDTTYQAYIPLGYDLPTLIYITNSITEGLKGMSYSPVCSPILVTWFCREKLQTGNVVAPLQICEVDPVTKQPIVPPAPLPPCREMCERFKNACLEAYAAGGIASLFDNYCEQFPNATTNCWSSEGYVYTPTHGNLTCPAYTAPFYFDGDLNKSDHRNRGQYGNLTNTCEAQCPSPEFSSSQFKDYSIVVQVFAWISFVGIIFVVIIYLFNSTLNTFPTRIVIYFFIATLSLSLAFMLITFTGGNTGELLCGKTIAFGFETIQGNEDLDSNIRVVNNDPLCVFQGDLILFGTLSTAFWWAILACNTFKLMHMAKKFEMMSKKGQILRELCYVFIGFGLPLIMVIIVSAAEKVGYEVTYIYCFITSSSNQAWRIGCWFVWMGLCLLAGTIALIGCIIHYYKAMRQHGSNPSKIIHLFRIILCLVTVFIFIVIIFASLILNAAEIENTRVQIVQYKICVLGGIAEPECRNNLYSNSNLQNQYNLAFASAVCMAAMGTILCLIFATNETIYSSLRAVSKSVSSLAKKSSSSSPSSMHSPSSSTTNEIELHHIGL